VGSNGVPISISPPIRVVVFGWGRDLVTTSSPDLSPSPEANPTPAVTPSATANDMAPPTVPEPFLDGFSNPVDAPPASSDRILPDDEISSTIPNQSSESTPTLGIASRPKAR
jgi:hypothetical protein